MPEETEGSLVKKSFWAIIEEYTIFRVIGILMLCYPGVYLIAYTFLGLTGGYFTYDYAGPPMRTGWVIVISIWLCIGAYLVVLGHYTELFKGRRRR